MRKIALAAIALGLFIGSPYIFHDAHAQQNQNVVVSEFLANGTLTSAQILALNTTPVTLIPAQGAGTVIVVDSFQAELVYGTITYTSGGIIAPYYGSAYSAALRAFAATCNAVVAASTSFCITTGIGLGDPSADYVNVPISLTVAANFASGDGTLKWWVKYHVLTGA